MIINNPLNLRIAEIMVNQLKDSANKNTEENSDLSKQNLFDDFKYEEDNSNIEMLSANSTAKESVQKELTPFGTRLFDYLNNLITTTSKEDDKGNKITTTYANQAKTAETTINKTGQVLTDVLYDISGNMIAQKDFIYNSNNRVASETIVSYDNGNINGKIVKTYDKKGNVVSEVQFDAAGNKLLENKTMYYSNNNKSSETITTYQNGKAANKVVNVFGPNGKQKTETKYETDNKISSETSYKYDTAEQSRILTQVLYVAGKAVEKFVQVFDKNDLIKSEKKYDKDEKLISEKEFPENIKIEEPAVDNNSLETTQNNDVTNSEQTNNSIENENDKAIEDLPPLLIEDPQLPPAIEDGVKVTIDANGNTVETTYSGGFKTMEVVTNADGKVLFEASYKYHSNGVISHERIIHASGMIEDISYDENGNETARAIGDPPPPPPPLIEDPPLPPADGVQVTTDADGNTVETTYASGQKTLEIITDPNGNELSKTSYLYHSNGVVAQERISVRDLVEQIYYDENGVETERLKMFICPPPPPPPPVVDVQVTTDANGNTVETTYSGGVKTREVVTNADGETTTVYNADNTKVETTVFKRKIDFNNTREEITYDAQGNVVSIIRYNANDEISAEIRYDSSGIITYERTVLPDRRSYQYKDSDKTYIYENGIKIEEINIFYGPEGPVTSHYKWDTSGQLLYESREFNGYNTQEQKFEKSKNEIMYTYHENNQIASKTETKYDDGNIVEKSARFFDENGNEIEKVVNIKEEFKYLIETVKNLDFNEDGQINFPDLYEFAKFMNTKVSEDNPHARFDIDKNGKIEQYDLSVFAQFYNNPELFSYIQTLAAGDISNIPENKLAELRTLNDDIKNNLKKTD